ncbi:hypothetical protein RB195_006809 [Necator americanus]|uniref:Uncharacterized protein n=1 Tax=Necator americanus TaxID=51031 RepID=A0ABR1BY65_NECAM
MNEVDGDTNVLWKVLDALETPYDDPLRLKQKQDYNKPTQATTQATTSTTVAEVGYIVMSTREVVVVFAIFLALSVLLVMIIRRRARMKALARNRRGNWMQVQSE